MTAFLTVKEAARRAGRSPSSIRRLVYPIIHDDTHADRALIQPSVDEALTLRTKGESFAWLVSEELLGRLAPAAAREQASGTAASKPGEGPSELLSMLRRELDIKNEQISQYIQANTKLMDTINSLTERLREGNILMGALQQQLKLADGRGAAPAAQPVNPKRPTRARPEKGSTAAVASKASKPKRGLFARLFGGR